MAKPNGRTLALGAAAALVGVPAVAAASAAGSGGQAAPPLSFVTAARSVIAAANGLTATAQAAEPPVRDRTLLVRVHGGPLQQIQVRKGLDPAAIAADLRKHPGTFTSAGADYVAAAADIQTDADGNPIAIGASTAATAIASTSPSATAATTQTGTLSTTPDSTSPLPTTPGTTPETTPSTTPNTTDGITQPPLVPGASTPVADIKGWIPNDHIGSVPWTDLQWNFAGKYGVQAPEAWATLRRRGAKYEGGKGVRVAVVDSGVAYRNRGVYRASPDLPASRILKGYDFVDDDRFPDDQSGHGTHVASTIAGATGNDAGVTGLAYNAEILPVRVLDDMDNGDVVAIARGIRYAANHGAQVLNLSVDFPLSVGASEIPEVMSAISYAKHKGVLIIASSGNATRAGKNGAQQVGLPARSPEVLSVGSTTVRGCRSSFANAGPDLDLSAPGGGPDLGGQRGCHPNRSGPPILQITILDAANPKLPPDPSQIGVPLDYVGTSMAAAHVTGVAALVLGSGVLGKHPSPDLLAAYLVRSTTDLGKAGRDDQFGAGLINAAQAVSRTSPKAKAALRGAKRAAAAAVAHHDSALPVL